MSGMSSGVTPHDVALTDPKRLWRTLQIAFALLLTLTAATELLAMLLIELHLADRPWWHQVAFDTGFLVIVVGLAGRVLIAGPLARRFAVQHCQLLERTAELEKRSHQQGIEAQLRRAFEMADDEPRTLRIAQRAMEQVSGGYAVELLLADSSQAHLRRAVASGSACDAPGSRCEVGSPRLCPATRQGSPQTFPSASALDACPFLAERQGEARSAGCVPVSIGGRTVGVIHATGDDGQPPPSQTLHDLTMIAAHTGSRLGVLRAMEASERAATTDPLTGLYNRRSLESRVDTLLKAGQPFAVAMADIDHFKKLNDTFGHSVGDRTLQTFARSLKASMRPDDIVARFGGEEFVIVVVGVDAAEGAAVMERARAELPAATARAGVPTVTASFGVADTTHGTTLDALVRVADEALYKAKREGRDRVLCAPGADIRPAPVVLRASA